jgi:AraC family transcriptional regulator
MTKEDSLRAYRDRLARALAYIQENLGGEISLDGAAAAACFSKYHFHRIFSAAMGESFADCVRRLRLERAANYLEHRPSMNVTDVAMASGFSSPSLLSRDFAERFGAPPTRWREERLAEGASAGSWSNPASPGEEPGQDEVRVEAMPALRFASCIHVGPYGPGIGEAWGRLNRWAGPRRLLGPKTGTAGVSWDNPEICPAESCRYSVCLPIGDEVEPSGDAILLSFPARSYLCLRYSGPEAGFAAAYSRLYRTHLPESGFEPEDDPAIEFYRGPARSASFDLDIALPVRALE